MRGILMIEPLVHATVNGLKTMTRRSSGLDMVNGSPEVKKNGKVVKPAIITNSDKWTIMSDGRENPGNKLTMVMFSQVVEPGLININNNHYCKPRYKVGEVLYIKEPILLNREQWLPDTGKPIYQYGQTHEFTEAGKWSNKLFMKAEDARHFIRITGIKCERLLDISDEDCVKEGIEYEGICCKNYMESNSMFIYENRGTEVTTFKASFISLYKFANKMKASAYVPNLWVFAYSYEYLPNFKL